MNAKVARRIVDEIGWCAPIGVGNVARWIGIDELAESPGAHELRCKTPFAPLLLLSHRRFDRTGTLRRTQNSNQSSD